MLFSPLIPRFRAFGGVLGVSTLDHPRSCMAAAENNEAAQAQNGHWSRAAAGRDFCVFGFVFCESVFDFGHFPPLPAGGEEPLTDVRSQPRYFRRQPCYFLR